MGGLSEPALMGEEYLNAREKLSLLKEGLTDKYMYFISPHNVVELNVFRHKSLPAVT